MKRLILVFAILFADRSIAEDPLIAGLFAGRAIQGALVISSLRSGQTFIHDGSRAARLFPAASTFKILNTLIGVEEGVVSGKDHVFTWDGTIRAIPDWNRDQTLESAFRVSCVWCFQEIARAVGAERYRRYLTQSTYGHLQEPFLETTFWIDGSLTISAIEQVEFLKRLYRRSLPFSARSYETLAQIMLMEQTPSFRLSAKTGLGGKEGPQIGWYVGYVETSEDVWFFATNMDIGDKSQLPLRHQITREALQAKGIID